MAGLDWDEKRLQALAKLMPDETSFVATRPSERRDRWVTWVTLVAGAVMCAVAALLS